MTQRDGRSCVLSGGAAAILVSVMAACDPAASPASSALASPNGGAPPAATPSASPAPSLGPISVELHALDPRYVPGGALTSASGQVLWAAGETWPSEIWRYVPGTAEPERLFASPREDSNITAVVAARSGYAFVELSQSAYGDGGWRIWFLSGPGEEPVELDRGGAKGAGFAPTIAMDDERIVWAGFDEPGSGAISRLAMASIGDLGTVTTLLQVPVREGLLWYPALNGEELWYGIIRADFDATGAGDEFHLEMLDLANFDAPPVRFPGSGNDFNPAVNDRFVVWKTADPGNAALTWGTLRVLDRQTHAVVTIPVADGNRPSIGDRYVAFEEITRSRLVVYDTVTGAVLDLRPPESPGTVGYGGQSVSGRLLAFYTQGTGRTQIGWAVLPE